MTNLNITTTKLNNGLTVLAKETKKYGNQAVSYCNFLQAETKQMILLAQGIESYIWGTSAKYIVIKNIK